MKQNIWEKEYKNVDSLWGLNPNSTLSSKHRFIAVSEISIPSTANPCLAK
ncbi:hypothetical protein [Peribacillus frigoritolerans]